MTTGMGDYRTLGRSGLRVAPLALGTMTFGTEWGWGSSADTARAIFDAYLESGGNFVDTADGYTNGTSESLIGDFMAARGDRDRVVLATKFSFSQRAGDPNAGGNGRKHVVRALEASLRRLRTDWIDVYWLHAWDRVTPLEEVVRTMSDLVSAGKLRYWGISNAPAWVIARAVTLADERGLERPIALQLEHSLVERNIEREHLPLASELGLGVCPWSPLASGLLSGKYRRDGVAPIGDGRLELTKSSGNPAFEKLLNARNWHIVDTLVDVAAELERTPAEVAMAWVTQRPGVTSTILGATRPTQLASAIGALELRLPDDARARLDAAGAPEVQYPEMFFAPVMQGMLSGGTSVRRP